ncbi:MAG: hemerythrin domain-containing protein [Methylococcaceae bacterium]
MTIAWDNRFNVGHSTIDAEHKALLMIINSIELALRHPDDKEALLYFFNLLYETAIDHFRYEEELQIKHSYQHQQTNADGHKNLIIELTRIIDEIRTITEHAVISEEDMLSLRKHVSFLAKGWLLAHVVQEDLKMKGFIADKY